MSSRSFLSVLCLVAGVWAAAPRAADAQTTALFLDSQPGDWVGEGHTWSYTAADATFSATTSSTDGTTISLGHTADDANWKLAFKASSANPAPAAGIYEAARLNIFFNKFVGLYVSNYHGCGELTGRFVVLEAVYGSDGSVTRFAADFEQHCQGEDTALFGAVRYNSTVSTVQPFGGAYPTRGLIVTPPANGSVQGDGLNCGGAGVQCAVTLSAAATTAIRAVPAPGFVFAGWSGDCNGGPRTTVRINLPKACAAAFTPIVPASPRTLAVITDGGNSVSPVVPIVVSPANSTWAIGVLENGFQLGLDFVSAKDPGRIWFYFTPPIGQSFEIGREYQAVVTADATHASFGLAGDAGGCSMGGTFTVRDWAAGTGGVPARFSIDFYQPCLGGVYGTLQYASSYEYGTLDVPSTGLHFTAVVDQSGIVGHSADQTFSIVPSVALAMPWNVRAYQWWLTATPVSGAGSPRVAARLRSGVYAPAPGSNGYLQLFARGIINVPDPVTVTVDLVPLDTTVRPFTLFRPVNGGWFMPGQGARQLGLPGDIPISGDFDGDTTPDIAIYRPATGEWFVQGQPSRHWGWPGDIPVPADYNGDGITDLAVFRQSGPSGLWFIFGEAGPRLWGARGDVLVPGDYDGDGLADVAVFRPATGVWRILRSSTGQIVVSTLGQAGDIPVVADFDADRRIDLAVFRPSTGVWYISFSAFGFTESRQFGLPGDIPVPLDVTGDGRAELRVWRPSNGTWYSFDDWYHQMSSQQYGLPGDVPVMARPVLIGSRPDDVDGDRRADVTIFRPSTGAWFTRESATAFSTFTTQLWGLADDIPVPGDYDGDRLANPAVYRPSTGDWFVRRFNGTMLQRAWGLPGDVPVPADYDGDGRTDMAVYRPSSGQWFILGSASDYAAYRTFTWGLPTDYPLPGDFDGDGRADAAVYRPSTGEWFVAASAGGYLTRQWGLPEDLPIARDFDGDGRADFAVYRPSTGAWFVVDAASGVLVLNVQWGATGDVPAADDYDGDGAADLAFYRPATSEWIVLPSSGAPSFVLQWGLAGDLPVTRR